MFLMQFGLWRAAAFLSFPIHLYRYRQVLGVYQNFSPRGVRKHRPLNVNLAPPIISETTRTRKLKLKTQLYVVKYWLQVQNFSAKWCTGGTGPGTGFLHFSGIAKEVMGRFQWNFMRQRLLKNMCLDLHKLLHVNRCQNMEGLIKFWARSGL